ncbi:hypothetical protein [Breoghania sp.]|uniref:hypothetical protein n=1 Tax=Breoghania sp. TaxID=2065378 RepID=UPI0026311281|nr:hypothetical protein [Breoghania sp.]MDJ0932241.1 hypothetical protein [Breoghania sp.]
MATVSAAIAAICAVFAAPVSAEAVERRIVTVPDADYFGADYCTVKDVSLGTCKAVCLGDPQCKASPTIPAPAGAS